MQKARDQVAALVDAQREEVIFTSGATESNNLAILGLAAFGEKSRRRHIISTQIEHKAVLEPLEELGATWFRSGIVGAEFRWMGRGRKSPSRIAPGNVARLGDACKQRNRCAFSPSRRSPRFSNGHAAYFHVDAAQTFGKLIEPLRNPRIDLIQCERAQNLWPKGVGALIARRRGFDRAPLTPSSLAVAKSADSDQERCPCR